MSSLVLGTKGCVLALEVLGFGLILNGGLEKWIGRERAESWYLRDAKEDQIQVGL